MGTQAGKIKRDVSLAPARKPSLARAEVVDKAARGRLEAELDAALKRRPTTESKLAGALRAVAVLSPGLRASMGEALGTMLRRGSFDRDLYGASLRALAEAEDKQTTALLKLALAADDAGGSAALSAACFSRDPALTAPLAKIAASRQSHLAFGAETARVVRKESNGAHLTALAPMIKESHRISMCVELFVPLARSTPVSVNVAPALAVLRGAERHLGRWLVMADVAVKAGDPGPLEEARSKATLGPSSARAAWSLVAWALSETASGSGSGSPAMMALAGSIGGVVPPPQTRPTVELVARLSDRPSADRDTTFLFRMARSRASVAKAMLEATARGVPLADDVAVRAALFLARDHARDDMRDALVETATTNRREELRGLAAAALWDIGLRDRAREVTEELLTSKVIGNVAWGALIRAAATRAASDGGGNGSSNGAATHDGHESVVTETAVRWIQWGWLE